MKKITKTLGAVIFTMLMSASAANAQFENEKITLKMGDNAPELIYSKWLKGTPVDITKGDQVFVLECWATWCGPCIAAMPHLSELAKKYEGKAVFIGADVWESAHSENRNVTVESTLPKVERFVNSTENRMTYNVIADNNAQDIGLKWLTAAGQHGIPCTFVVQHNKVLWIGHPLQVDKILAAVVDGTYDVIAAQKAIDDQKALAAKAAAPFTESQKALQDALTAKDYKKAFSVIDEYSSKYPNTAIGLKTKKFSILLDHFSESEALNYGAEAVKTPDFGNIIGYQVADIILKKDGLSKAAYQMSAQIFLDMKSTFCLDADKAAQAYFKAGDLKSAVATETKAVDLARVQVKNPAYQGRVMDYTVTELEGKLKLYQDKLN